MKKLMQALLSAAILASLVAACSFGDPPSNNVQTKQDDPRLPRKLDPKKAELGLEYLSKMNDGIGPLNDLVFETLPRVWEDVDQQRLEGLSEEERDAQIYEYYGMVRNPYDTRVPMGFNLNQQGVWVITCASCHAGTVNGKTALGIGNIRFDQSLLFEDIYKAREILAEEGRDPVEALGPLPPYLAVAKDNIPKTANNSLHDTVFLFSYRNPDLSIRNPADPENPQGPIDLGEYQAAPVDVPAWWILKKKSRLYSLNVSSYTPRSLMQFFIGMPNMQLPEIAPLEGAFQNVVHFIDSLNPEETVGPYPGDINPRLARQGRGIFEDTCSRCHGTYGNNWEYPERVVRIEDLQTDSAQLDSVTQEFIDHVGQSWFNSFGEKGTSLYGFSPGYISQPLDGVWATAPYFHNGSVPTLAAVLGIEERPVVWKVSDYERRDLEKVGLLVDSVDEIPDGLTRRDARFYYDTRRHGSSASGHDYPNELSLDEKIAVLEYLKTL